MSDSSREVFDNYEQHYATTGARNFRSLQDVQRFRLDRLPRWIGEVAKQAHILDAGCASGYLLGLLHDSGYTRLTGVDLSAQLLSKARQNLPNEVALHQSDILTFLTGTPDASFDVILFHHVLEHIPREHTIALLREFRRCLSEGGVLNIKVPNAGCLLMGHTCFGDFTHVVHFNEVSLVQVLEQAGFDRRQVRFVLHPPMLFWSWQHPLRAVFRVLNRLRWHLSAWTHRAAGVIFDTQPKLRCHEIELEVVAKK